MDLNDPTHAEIVHLIQWLVGLLVAFGVAFVGIWQHIDKKKEHKLDEKFKNNDDDHRAIHHKIDNVRDKVEDIWKHLVSKDR